MMVEVYMFSTLDNQRLFKRGVKTPLIQLKKNIMRTRRTKEQIRKDNYNKDVDAYNFYVVNLDTKRAETGFEFKEDAVDVLNDYDDKKKYKVVSKRALKSMGIENPNESFKYEGGGDFQSGVYATGGGIGDKKYHIVIQKDNNYIYLKMYDNIQDRKDYGNRLQELLMTITNYGDVDVVTYTTEKEIDTEEKFEKFFKNLQKKLNYAKGGSLIGNQKRIDLNKNGKIDAEDFKLLRTTMNGGWRKDHKYVNSSNPKEDYEVIYARKYKPSRKGYKGKTNFATGGGVDRFSEYSNDALYDMIINLSRYENTESDIQMVKAELEKRKRQNSDIQQEIDLTDDKVLRLRKPIMPERKYSEREWAEKFNPRAYEFMGKRKMATGGSLNLDFRNFTLNDLIKNLPQDVDFMWISKINSKDYVRRYNKEFNKYANKKYTISDFGKIELSKGSENLYLDMKVFEASDEAPETEYIISIYTKDNQKGLKEFTNNLVQKFATGGGISKFKMLSDKVARNYEGKRVKPQYRKEYGKVYSKSEAKEVGDKVAGKVKANQKMATGGETKKGARGGIMTLAKKIRKDGEKWTDAVKRAGQQLK
jgi:hypothetical protein